jgi:hypothetical protein
MVFLAKEVRARLVRLTDKWERKKGKIARTQVKMARLGPCGSFKPSFYAKFLKYLRQIAFFHEKELDIISKIDAIERKHRFMRKNKRLKRAARKEFIDDLRLKARRKADRDRRIRWWLILFFLWIMSQTSKKPEVFRAKPAPR